MRYPNLVEPKQPQTTPDTAKYHSQPKTGGKNEFGEKIVVKLLNWLLTILKAPDNINGGKPNAYVCLHIGRGMLMKRLVIMLI